MKAALIKNNIVENVIVSSLEFAQTLGYDSVLDADGTTIGPRDKLIDGVWTKPEPVVIRFPTLTSYDFLKRFTSEERKAISSSKKNNLDVEDIWMMWSLAPQIDLDSQETIDGLNLLVSQNLLTAQRVIEIRE